MFINFIKLSFLIFIVFINLNITYAEDVKSKKDSTLKEYHTPEVAITATKTDRFVSLLPMPVYIIPQREIENSGAQRLDQILNEQTGLNVTFTSYGLGLQMQGFNPDHTLILVDGEPVIGRTGGVLDLKRIAVSNIKTIEIVKGPSSSLFGSDALAGVVNIITQNPENSTVGLKLRQASHNTGDLSADMGFKLDKFFVNLFANYYKTDGYDLSPDLYGRTVGTSNDFTIFPKFTYRLSDETEIKLSTKYYQHKLFNESESIDNNRVTRQVKEDDKSDEYSINANLKQAISEKLKLNLRFYSTYFKSNTNFKYINNDSLFDGYFFNQSYNKPELQLDYSLNNQNIFTFGAGLIHETVESSRYVGLKKLLAGFSFLQADLTPIRKLNVIGGLRYDAHSDYKDALSPKLSLRYEVSEKFSVSGTAGLGFKSPDFRQLYMNFNNLATGYSVYGSSVAKDIIQQMIDAGQIKDHIDLNTIKAINPENSKSFDLSFKYRILNTALIDLNLFRNDIDDLIDTKIVAITNDNKTIYSYINLNKAYTQGFELNLSCNAAKYFDFLIGYQYLDAKDKNVVNAIEAGQIFRRIQGTTESERVKHTDYGGLFNRSKHMINVKVSYDNFNTGTTANFRLTYRNRLGFADLNNNGILDADNEYAQGFVMLNIFFSQTVFKGFDLHAGIDNMLDYKDDEHMPNIPGRIYYIGFSSNLDF